MTEKTITRAELTDALYREVGLSYHDSNDILDTVFDTIIRFLEKGETDINIKNFGRFVVREKKERVGRNPKTGKEAVISKRRVLTFRPAQQLKDQVE